MRASYPMTGYYVAVAARDLVLTAVSTRFCHAPPGRSAPLFGMAEGDWLAYYSPREIHGSATPCRRFTAIGRVAPGRVQLAQGSEGLEGNRRPMRYLRCYPVPAAVLVRWLSFVRNPKVWAPSFRAGFFRVSREDFTVIAQAMLSRV